MNRPAPFSLRLTPEERQKLEAQAGAMPLASYIKSVVFAAEAPKYRKRRNATHSKFCFGSWEFHPMMFHLCSFAMKDNKRRSPKQKNAKRQKDEAMTDIPPEFNPETAPPHLSIDWDAYLPLLENEDISEEQKRELIEALWSIMVSFVDLGFGIHPLQQVCGQDISLAELPAADVLNLDNIASEFDQAAAPQESGQREGSL